MPFAVRAATRDDAAGMLAVYAPFVRETHVSFEAVVPSVEDFAARIEAAQGKYPWLVASADGGDVVGYAYASAFRARAAYQWTTEVSAYICPAAQRSGLGRTLYQALLEALTKQGFKSALAVISLPNAASVGFHERLGFKSVGLIASAGRKFGRWHDVGFWQLMLGAPDQ